MMSEQLISQIRTLAKTEKYKQDSFFFCGSPSDMPNTALLNACEAYLDAVSGNRQDPELISALVHELEAIAPARPTAFALDNANAEGVGTASVIWNILDHQDLL